MTVEKQVIEGELVDTETVTEMTPQPLKNPPAVRTTYLCACGKDGTAHAHGHNDATGHRALTCDEVADIRDRVNADVAASRRDGAR